RGIPHGSGRWPARTWRCEMLRWEKKGRIFVADGSKPWMLTHASLPVADQLDAETLRVYFASRDNENRSRIASIDLATTDPLRILKTASEPLLPLGQRGTFDDNGMTPSCIVADGQFRYLYYIGWNPQVTVSYRLAIGLAVSEDA